MNNCEEEIRERLFNILYSRSFIYREDPPFRLASGATSSYYFDCKNTTLDPEGCSLVGKLIFYEITRLNIDLKGLGIGGLTLGADPISLATSLEAYRNGSIIYPIIVRKEPKGHGTGKWLEGNVNDISRVIVIDDVITTGGSTILAIKRMRESSLQIEKAMVIVDREEGGRENIEASGVDIVSLFNRSHFDKRRIEELENV